jgi:hypothetical protein
MTDQPRTLRDYWNFDFRTERARDAWRDFIQKWLFRHRKDWDTAEKHWLNYVHDYVRLDEFEHLHGAPLLRKAEASAQQWLARQMAARVDCAYCEKVAGRPGGSTR